MDGIRTAVRDLFHNGHDIPVRVLDGVIAQLSVFRDDLFQVRRYDLIEFLRAEKGIYVKAIVRAEGKSVQQMPALVKPPGKFQRLLHPDFGLLVHLLRLLVHPSGEFHHPLPVRDGPGGIAVCHDVILITALLPDQLQKPLGGLQPARIGMDKYGAVAVSLGRVYVELGHFVHVQALLPTAHLIPLGVMAVGGVYFPELLHGQEIYQLKGRNLPSYPLAFQCPDKFFTICHFLSPDRFS